MNKQVRQKLTLSISPNKKPKFTLETHAMCNHYLQINQIFNLAVGRRAIYYSFLYNDNIIICWTNNLNLFNNERLSNFL